MELLQALSDDGPAIVGLAESGGLGIVLGTEPAIRASQRGVGAARLHMINADIAGDTRAQGKFALDAAARRHHRLARKQHVTYFAILVGSARPADQGAVLSPGAKFLRRHKAAL